MTRGFSISVWTPNGTQRDIEIRDVESITIGRDPSCHVVLPSPAVSRHHLQIERVQEGARLTDRSSNGTLLGDEVLRASDRPLPPDGRIRVGPYVVRVRAIHSGSAVGISPAIRRQIHRELLDHLDLASLSETQMEETVLRPRVVEALERIVSTHASDVGRFVDVQQLVSEMTDEVLGLGPLQDLLDDEGISEIMVVDPSTIYIERDGRIQLTALRFTDDESCRAAIERIVTPLGRRIDESTPLVDARLRDGSRVNAIIPPLAIRGPCITIRKFARRPLEIDDLVARESLTERMAIFLERCVCARKNLVISGGTGSGKTTLLNLLSKWIPGDERIVTIEDAAELRLEQPHVVSLEAKPRNLEGQGEYTIRDLLKNALRMRPDRILVGECRAGEAIDMLQAMNTGHEGSMTTTHANSVSEALKRIETLCMMAGLDLAPRTIREQIAASIHVVVQQARFSDGARRLTSIAEVEPLGDDGELSVREIFVFHRTGTAADGTVLGEHRPTGYVPSFLDAFITQGLVEAGDYL